ncbi:MAG TPA: hypothetical protein VF457_15675 [Burkholderiaceae bacterium]
MRNTTQAPDWAIVIADIVATGLTESDVAQRAEVSNKAIRYLARGVQPLFHRGDALVELWCAVTRKARAELPLVELVRGHRKARGPADTAPRLQNLPAFPAPAQRTDLQGKKRAPRKAKVLA